MKRRTLLSLGLSGLAVAIGQRYVPNLLAQGSLSGSALSELSDPAGSGSSEIGNALFRFIAIGDVGTGKRPQYNVARAMYQRWQASDFPLTLMTGDNIYPHGEIEKISEVFEQPYAPLLDNGVKFYAALGNHDILTNQGEDQLRYPHYNMAARYYTFTRAEQSIQFFALDTNQAIETEEGVDEAWMRQLDWLGAELQKSRSPWKVVFAHHPVYSSGRHGSSALLIETLSPLLKAHGVQLYLNGHDHHYERSHPIDGTTYITTGNGAKLRRVGRSDWTAQAKSQRGFTVFELQADRLIIKAIDTRNRVYDQASIEANISASHLGRPAS